MLHLKARKIKAFKKKQDYNIHIVLIICILKNLHLKYIYSIKLLFH